MTDFCADYCTCTTCDSLEEETCLAGLGFALELSAIDGCDTHFAAWATCQTDNNTCVDDSLTIDPSDACDTAKGTLAACADTVYSGELPLAVAYTGMAASCSQMIACDIALAAAWEGRDAYYSFDDPSYGRHGICWTTTASSESCATACESAVDAYITAAEAGVTGGNIDAIPTECTTTPPEGDPNPAIENLGGDTTYCQSVCDCTICSSDERDTCELIGEYQDRLAAAAGCTSYFDTMTACVATEKICITADHEIALPEDACTTPASELITCLGQGALPPASSHLIGGLQAESCAAMIACDIALAAALDSWTGVYTTDDPSYGPNGTCWSTPAISDACANACDTTLGAYITMAEAYVTSEDLTEVPAECAMP